MMSALRRSDDQFNTANIWQNSRSAVRRERSAYDLRFREIIPIGFGRDIPAIHGANHSDASIARTPTAATAAAKEVDRPDCHQVTFSSRSADSAVQIKLPG
jgi:hypothetical protein